MAAQLANNNSAYTLLGNVTFNSNTAPNHDGGAIYNYNSPTMAPSAPASTCST